jgi:hypothetical protein
VEPEQQGELFGAEQAIELGEESEWHWNGYAGSILLYAALEWSGFLKPFEEHIVEEDEIRKGSWGLRRVLLTLFFMHALRCKSVEQGKHIDI